VRYYTSPNTPPTPSLFPAQTGPTLTGDENIPTAPGRSSGARRRRLDRLLDRHAALPALGQRRAPTQVYSGIFADISSATDQPSATCVETSAGSCGSFQLIHPQTDRYNAGWESIGGALPTMASTSIMAGRQRRRLLDPVNPQRTNVQGYGIALVTNSSNNVQGFNLDGTVQQTLTDYLAAHNGSILDPQCRRTRASSTSMAISRPIWTRRRRISAFHSRRRVQPGGSYNSGPCYPRVSKESCKAGRRNTGPDRASAQGRSIRLRARRDLPRLYAEDSR